MMNKFFIMTRGRTGSTAIIDELNKTKSIRTAQELFLKFDFMNLEKQFKNLMEHYQSMLPFELWKNQNHLRRRLHRLILSDRILISHYLKEMETSATDDGVEVFGFKVLSHNFEEIPLLSDILFKRGYRVIYLKRNIPHQVISGMIAKQRGIYNTKNNYKDDHRYQIDVSEFRNIVNWECQAVRNDIAFINAVGFKFIEVSYEEYMDDRQKFFGHVLSFLDVPIELPQASLYSVMIKDLKYTVKNYQEVADCATEMDMRIE